MVTLPLACARPTTRYVDRWNFQSQSVCMTGVSSYQFLLPADQGCLESYLRRYFNEPSGGSVDLHPLAPLVMLQVATTSGLAGSNGDFPSLGIERSASLLIFATDRHNDDAFLLGIPYIVVDNPMSMVLAREAFGIPKDIGVIQIPFGQSDPERIGVAVCGVADVSQPDAAFKIQPFLEIRRTGGPHSMLHELTRELGEFFVDPGRELGELGDSMRLLLEEGNLGMHALGLLVEGTFRMVCLKQFREAATNVEACYQKIACLNNTLTRRGGMRHLGSRYEVEFFALDSHPVARDLGLTGVCDSTLSFWMDYDFKIDGSIYP